MSIESAHNRPRATLAGFMVFSPFILTAAGIAWGYAWISAFHAIPGFVVISPIVDILVYRYVGTRLHYKLRASNLNRGVQILLGAFDIAVFYIGNRVILFGWVLAIWPYEDSELYWILVLMDILSITIGIATATGLVHHITQSAHDHETHPKETQN